MIFIGLSFLIDNSVKMIWRSSRQGFKSSDGCKIFCKVAGVEKKSVIHSLSAERSKKVCFVKNDANNQKIL